MICFVICLMTCSWIFIQEKERDDDDDTDYDDTDYNDTDALMMTVMMTLMH